MAYQDYTIHKQTYAELEVKYARSEKTLRKYFDRFCIKISSKKELGKFEFDFKNDSKTPTQNLVNIVMDTTFFGRDFGVMVFRAESKNLAWRYVTSEKLIFYLEELYKLIQLTFSFKSFTIDGRKGLIKLLKINFLNIPIQLCHFHQVAIVLRYTTQNPVTDCGKVLKELILKLKSSTKTEFINEFENLQNTYKDFLKEKNDNNQFQHKRLRSAIRSIKTNLPYLFTFEDYPELNIPKTSNSAEGSFGHWKYKVRLHRHLRIDRKKQLIDNLLSA